MRDRENRNANPHHCGEADPVGPIRAQDEVKARPPPPPRPRRPNVSDARASDDATESPHSVAGTAATTREEYSWYSDAWD
eukprot:8117449-Pyramimonas_sp.AAC.1